MVHREAFGPGTSQADLVASWHCFELPAGVEASAPPSPDGRGSSWQLPANGTQVSRLPDASTRWAHAASPVQVPRSLDRPPQVPLAQRPVATSYSPPSFVQLSAAMQSTV